MYYGIDDDGRISSYSTRQELPSPVSTLFPDVPDDSLSSAPSSAPSPAPSPSFSSSLSSFPDFDIDLPDYSSEFTSLQQSVDALSDDIELYAVGSTNSYPSTTSVNVFRDVVNSLSSDYAYVVFAGSDSSNSILLYSKDYTVTGNRIEFTGDVTRCNYYRYRPSNYDPWEYRYAVDSISYESVDLSNGALYYTSLVPGYPDLRDSVNRVPAKFQSLFSVVLLVVIVILLFRRRSL